MKEIQINNLDEMKKFAINFAKKLSGGEIILLNGDLGAGKTTLVRFILESLGVTEPVNSPSFTIMKTYQNDKLKFFHFDMYRIENEEECIEIGFEDYIQNDKNMIVFIEWSERVASLLKNSKTQIINIDIVQENKRKVVVYE